MHINDSGDFTKWDVWSHSGREFCALVMPNKKAMHFFEAFVKKGGSAAPGVVWFLFLFVRIQSIKLSLCGRIMVFLDWLSSVQLGNTKSF